MTFAIPSGGYCIVREKYPATTKDDLGRDIHWLILVVEHYATEVDFKAGKPPLLAIDHWFQSGLLNCKTEDGNPAAMRVITAVIDKHFADGLRGSHHLDADRPKPMTDHAGFLAHPHVAAIQVTP